MRRCITIASLFLASSFTLSAQENKDNYILALSVDLYTNTSSSISCDTYAATFERIFTVNVVSKSDSISIFSDFIQHAKYARHNRGIDVRCKFIYEMDDKRTTTVCTDGLNVLVNGRLIKKNKRFIDFLNSIVHRYPRK